MVIEHNATTSGSYEVTGLSDGAKVVLARAADGETFGYASVSGTVAVGETYLLTIDTTEEYETAFTDESFSGTTYFNAVRWGVPAINIVVLDNNAGTAGANALSNGTFTTSEKVTLEFMWRGAPDASWYSDNLSNAMNYIAFVNPLDYQYSSDSWGYHNITCTNGIFVHLRSSSENVTYRPRYNNVNYEYTESIIDLDNTWRPVKIELDWPNENVRIWVDATEKIDQAMEPGLAATFTDGFKINFHWHSYRETEAMGYKDFEIYTGAKLPPTGVGTLLEESDCTGFAEDFYKNNLLVSDTYCAIEEGHVAVRLYAGSTSGSSGSNIYTSDLFPTTGTSTITFDWYPAQNGDWYTDEMSNAMNYIWFSGPYVRFNPVAWAYNRPELSEVDGFAVHLRQSLTTFTNSHNSIITNAAIDNLVLQWRPVSVVIDWNDGTIQTSVDNVVKISASLPAGAIATFTEGFKFGFHWHSYQHSGKYQSFRNIKLVQS
jgi:hypothetical protein